MAVLTANQTLAPERIGYDSRFKAWAKLIGKPEHVDLTKPNGYSLAGPFVGWGKSVAVAPGQFLVLAAETGSRARHGYRSVLIRVNGNDEPEVVSDEEIAEAVAAAPDRQRAAAANNPLYAYAVYCARALQPGPISQRIMAQANRIEETPQLLVARRAMEALTDAERAALFAEFGMGR